MEQLKNCPFCGAKAVAETFETCRERKPRYRVKCTECWCETSWDFFSVDEVAEAWNRRADDGTD